MAVNPAAGRKTKKAQLLVGIEQKIDWLRRLSVGSLE
jgi:hypothetical protein